MAQVPNKNIDNASGQVVRLDIQNTGKAIATHNFGPRNDAGTILPCEFLADDTTNKLLIRKSSGGDQANPNPTSGTAADFFVIGNLDTEHLGLLPRTGTTTFPMTGQLIIDDGSAANAPAIAFDGDADTGIFRVGPNTIGFATAGVERVEISDAGLDMSNGLAIRFQDSSGAPYVALKSPPSVGDNRTFTLPATTGSVGQFLSVATSNHSATNAELEFATPQSVPTGAVFCMAVLSVPTGYLECNGAAVSRTTYAALFAVIGTQYGTGNGSSTFNLPDLRGEFVRGFDNGRNIDSDRVSASDGIGSSQTSQNKQHNHTATSSVTDPGHRHLPQSQSANSQQTNGHGVAINDTIIGNYGGGSGVGLGPIGNRHFLQNTTTGISVSTTTANDGGSETRPRNVAMMYVIRT